MIHIQMDIKEDREPRFKNVRRFFRCKRFQDSSWSWVVCISVAVCNAIILGFALSFGVMFPELMKYFNTTRERTGMFLISLFQFFIVEYCRFSVFFGS